MKQIIFLATLVLSAILSTALNAQVHERDTIIYFNNKSILLNDSADQLTVAVYKHDSTRMKEIYKGIYTDESSYEQYSVESEVRINFPFIDYPFNKKKKCSSKISGHFAGFGVGKLLITENLDKFNDIDGMIISGSNEIVLNPIGYTASIIRGYLGITTGLGMQWQNLHLGNNTHLVNREGKTVVESAPDNIKYYYSRLRTFDITMPLFIELQPSGKPNLYLSGGIQCGFNTFSSYKVKYKDANGKKVKTAEGKDYNVRPFSLSYVAQMGWNDFGVYAKYTPTRFFYNDKGPDIQTLSVGLKLNF